jgi:hypothetical protein
VIVDAHVVLRAGMLEFLACFAGKEHESVLRIDAHAAHIYMALGLIGLSPGHPPRWDPDAGRLLPPRGDLIDLHLRWTADKRKCETVASNWLAELEYARPPLARPWIFSGSLRRPDGALASDVSGVGVALVDFPDNLLSYSRRFSSRSSELWAAANTAAIPPLDTRVELIFRPAKRRDLRVRLDGRGASWVDGRFADWADLADILALNHRIDPDREQTIVVSPALPRAAAAVFERTLRARGCPPGAFRLERSTP